MQYPTHDTEKSSILWAIFKNPWLLSMSILFVLMITAFVFLSFIYTNKASNKYEYEQAGDMLYRQGKYEEAVSSWQKILNMEPKDTKIVNKIGIAYLESDKINEAYEYYAEKCKTYPEDLNLRYNLAIACFKKDYFDESRGELDKIYGVNPYFPRLYYLRGLIYEKEGDWAKAKAEYIKEINMNPADLGAWYKIKQSEKIQEKVE